MHTRAVSLMWVLSLLASCFGRKTPAEREPTVAEYPRFPATDVADAAFALVALDDGYRMKSFFIAPDKASVYVLGHRSYEGKDPDGPYLVELTDLRLFALDAKGRITRRFDMKRTDLAWGSSMAMIDGELLVLTGDQFVVIDAASFRARERIPVWHDQHFPTAGDIEMMTPDEQRDAYVPLMDAALRDCAGCRWLAWPSGQYFVMAPGPRGKRAAWSPLTYADEVVAPLRQRFAPLTPSMNPHVSTDAGGDGFTAVDGDATLREEDLLSGGTQLDYPNYKGRMVAQYALTTGPRVVHFSTTDRDRQDLRLGFADNVYLTTADGAVWVRYMGELFRMEAR
jgi:hypothetical protein